MKKPHTTPTNQETLMKDEELIVSKTDLKSKIVYGNKYFIEMSGWSEEEILHKPHNMLRHPDMPQCAFKSFYDHLREQKEWFGYVKNLKKDGGYYWVFASVTVSVDTNGTPIGYYSVRRRPREGFKSLIEPLYNRLRNVEQNGGVSAGEAELSSFLSAKKLCFNEVMLKIQSGEINEL